MTLSSRGTRTTRNTSRDCDGQAESPSQRGGEEATHSGVKGPCNTPGVDREGGALDINDPGSIPGYISGTTFHFKRGKKKKKKRKKTGEEISNLYVH